MASLRRFPLTWLRFDPLDESCPRQAVIGRHPNVTQYTAVRVPGSWLYAVRVTRIDDYTPRTWFVSSLEEALDFVDAAGGVWGILRLYADPPARPQDSRCWLARPGAHSRVSRDELLQMAPSVSPW